MGNSGRKAALITGSTSGIGKETAVALAGNGFSVTISGLEVQLGEKLVQDIRAKGGEAVYFRCDLTEEGAAESLVQQTADYWGRIDLLVNNAAIICHKQIEDVRYDDWNRLFAVNLRAAFFTVQAAMPWLAATQGSVINISSTNGIVNSPENFVYDSLKAALNHLTRGLSLDLRKKGIRVNALMPGGTETPTLQNWLVTVSGSEAEAERLLNEEKQKGLVADPKKIAQGVLLLASPESSWINGAVIPIDGGFHIGK